MAFRALVNRDNIWRRFWLLLRHSPRRGLWFSRVFVRAAAVAALAPPLLVWWSPPLLPYAVALLVLISGATLWWQWPGLSHWAVWAGAGATLVLYWASQLLGWLFLEGTFYRVIFLALLMVVTWWYLDEWHHVRQKLIVGEPVVSSAPTLVVGFLTAMALGTAAESFVVYLDVSLVWLLLGLYLPLVLSFMALAQACGWRPLRLWRQLVTAVVVLAEGFYFSDVVADQRPSGRLLYSGGVFDRGAHHAAGSARLSQSPRVSS